MKDRKERRLVAIMFTDIVGYSRIMQDDEQKGIQIRKRHRQVFRELTQKHDGELLQYFGDGTLSIFKSSSSAVECAVAMQREFQKDPKVPLRIGIHAGDIIFTEDDAYGHGMNIAARIEGLADPGGICISRGAYDHIRNKLNFGYEYIGEHAVKNIKHPVRVYKILMAPEDAGRLIGEEKKHGKALRRSGEFRPASGQSYPSVPGGSK